MKISVTQLNNYLKSLVSTDPILSNLTVEGETTNVKYSNGNLYFSIKDNCSLLECFSFAQPNLVLTDGKKVTVFGHVNFSQKFGKMSFFCSKIEIQDDFGEKYKQLLLLKQKLDKIGCFDENHKKNIPQNNKNVGVVTSKNGAVISDIKSVISRRNPATNIYLYSVKVQGENADEEIASGINYFSNSNVDVVIVARGGGSNEDLSAFNSEKVVLAVYNCKKPIVSAVGHGVDFTLCDLASDRRAVTPSEAGEFVTEDVFEKRRIIIDKLNWIKRLLSQKLITKENEISNCLKIVDAINPLNLLKKGYSFATINNRPIKSVKDLGVNDIIELTLADGNISAQVKTIKEDQNDS